MLKARIKGVNKCEITKFVFGNKAFFKYKDVTYHIKPECIYSYTVFYFITVKAIDFVQGNGQPINYYIPAYERSHSVKNVDTISMLIRRILEGKIKNFQLIVLILLVVNICVAVASVVLPLLGD